MNRRRLLDAARGIYNTASGVVEGSSSRTTTAATATAAGTKHHYFPPPPHLYYHQQQHYLDPHNNNNNNSSSNGTGSSSSSSGHSYRPLRSFRLKSRHLQDAMALKTPADFHSALCQKIRTAKERVVLASLYIGPNATTTTDNTAATTTTTTTTTTSGCQTEEELLQALTEAANKPNVRVQVLLDQNRALRQIPIVKERTTTCSAQAVYKALQSIPLLSTTTTTEQNTSFTVSKSNNNNNNNNHLYLFSVLPPWLQTMLPNPYNKVAGVFHLKVYIVDSCLILSGANLSREYFVDRHDRYLCISHGGNGLVDWYADLIHILCRHATLYSPEEEEEEEEKNNHHDNDHGNNNGQQQQQQDAGNGSEKSKTMSMATATNTTTTRTELLEELNQLMTTTVDDDDYQGYNNSNKNTVNNKNTDILDDDNDEDDDTVAIAIPTFQAPAFFFSDVTPPARLLFPMDTQVTTHFLQAALHDDPAAKLCISSAYLNPTDSLLRVLSQYSNLQCLTAGLISHGFAPKKTKTAGSKGKDWIPDVFLQVGRQAQKRLRASAKLFYYQRPGWTFHAKGLWLWSSNASNTTTSSSSSSSSSSCTTNTTTTTNTNNNKKSLVAAVCGSANYGARSERLDLESNCILVFPKETSDFQQQLEQEWKDMMKYCHNVPATTTADTDTASGRNEKSTSLSTTTTETVSLSLPLRVCLPIIRRFL